MAGGTLDASAAARRPEPDDGLPELEQPEEGTPTRGAGAGRMPTPSTRFIGRHQEAAAVHELVARSRLVTAVGPGGCGKSRLAIQVGESRRADYPDGVWWVDLQQLTSDQAVAPAICAALGLREQAGVTEADLLRRYAAGHTALVVLDNCEHVLESCAEVVARVLDGPGGLRFLATSREALVVPGELVWPVPSMPVPRQLASMAELAQLDAVQLFADRARAVLPEFRLNESNLDAIGRICARLDGLPLAIELAAAQSPALTPGELAPALDDSLRLLTRGSRGVHPRHRTLRASVQWSVALLDGDERLLLSRLAVFHGGFSLEGARLVCGDELLDEQAVLVTLASLVHKSLVAVDDHGGRRRFRLLETTRQYAEEQLEESGKADTVRDRHLEHMIGLTGRELVTSGSAGGAAAGFAGWLDELDRERGNLQTALNWALIRGDRRAPLRLAAGVGVFFGVRGYFAEGRRFLADALAAGDPQPSRDRAQALWGSAYVGFVSADVSRGVEQANAALEMARTCGDTRTAARVLMLLGGVAVAREPERARSHLTEAVRLAREVDDDWCLTLALGHVAQSWAWQSRLEPARQALAEVSGLVERLGSPHFRAWLSLVVTIVALRGGELAAAVAAAARVRQLAIEVADPVGQAHSVAYGAEIGCWRGRAAQTRRDIVSLDAEFGLSTRGPFIAMYIHAALGKCAIALGRLDEAARYLERAIQEAGQSHRTAEAGAHALDLAEIALLRDRPADAATILDRAMRSAEAVDDPWLLAGVNVRLGRLAAMTGDWDKARELVCVALAAQRDGGYWLEAVTTLETLAGLFALDGAPLRGVRLFAAATAARRRLGARRCRADCLRDRVGRDELARTVGRAELRVALREGAGLSLEEAIGYALRGRGVRARPSSGWDGLTPTELAIARLVADGHSNPEIAARIFVSRATVKAHLARVFAKTGVSNRAQLAAEAIRRNAASE